MVPSGGSESPGNALPSMRTTYLDAAPRKELLTPELSPSEEIHLLQISWRR